MAAAPNRRALFDVQRLLGEVSLPATAPAAPAPPGMVAHPKHYQLTGLQWMLGRERQGDARGRGQLHLHPAWLQLVAADGQLLHLHRLRPSVLSPCFFPAPVGGTCGGFLSDQMGLGKTLEVLMLVLRCGAGRGGGWSAHLPMLALRCWSNAINVLLLPSHGTRTRTLAHTPPLWRPFAATPRRRAGRSST